MTDPVDEITMLQKTAAYHADVQWLNREIATNERERGSASWQRAIDRAIMAQEFAREVSAKARRLMGMGVNKIELGAGIQGKRGTHYLTLHGERMSVLEWAEELDIKPGTINLRIARGWTDVEKILSRPSPEDGRTTRTTGWLKKRKRAKKPVDRKRRGAVMSNRGKRILTPRIDNDKHS